MSKSIQNDIGVPTAAIFHIANAVLGQNQGNIKGISGWRLIGMIGKYAAVTASPGFA